MQIGDGENAPIISGDTIVIATGSRPFIPSYIEESKVTYYTNETIMRMPDLPRSMVVLGGGYIAMEFAHVFSALGVNVTVVNRSPQLLRVLDEDISHRFTEITKTKMDCRLGRTVSSVDQDSNGVTLTLDDGSTATGEVLLVATGRIPNGDQMNLDSAGNRHGWQTH